jgi:hypothetical protein
LSGGLFGCSTTVGDGGLKVANQPADLPIVYHNSQYDFTFFLPASWKGYSVLLQQWNDEAAWHGPIIVLRHPQWKAGDLYQDVPIMVFTRSQWDALHSGKFFPYAGGVISEMCHNRKYVFGIYSRYNSDDSVKGWKEAEKIVDRNYATNARPHLYPE